MKDLQLLLGYYSLAEENTQSGKNLLISDDSDSARPSQVGTKTREVGRLFARKVTPGEVTKYEPNREVAFIGLSG